MESIPCNLCGQDTPRPRYTVTDTNYGTPGTFHIVQCRHCGLVYLNPRPTPAEIGAYDPAATYHPFRAVQQTGRETAVSPPKLHQQRAAWLTRHTEAKHRHSRQRVLDVGCGSGLFLLAMQQRGWQTAGVEPSPVAADFARTSLGLEVRTGDIFQWAEPASFDLITLWDVLEHTHSPTAVLRHAHHLLTPTGRLALNVPNWASFERQIFGARWIALDPPRHLYHFTPATLRQLFTTTGFTPDTIRAQAPVLSLASNVLRRIGDTVLRQGQAKVTLTPTPAPTAPTAPHRLIWLTHQLMRPPNTLANALNRGAGITAVCHKA